MARALRDAAQPTRLQLYDHPEAFQELTQAAPWFLTLLEPVSPLTFATLRAPRLILLCSISPLLLPFYSLHAQLKNKPDGVLPAPQTNSTIAAESDADTWAQDPLPTQLSGRGLDVEDLSF
jgi:hypothetical protein